MCPTLRYRVFFSWKADIFQVVKIYLLRAPGDELPFEEGIITDGTRYKLIHSVGTVGQVSLHPDWPFLTSNWLFRSSGRTSEVTVTPASSKEPPRDTPGSPRPRNPPLPSLALLLAWDWSSSGNLLWEMVRFTQPMFISEMVWTPLTS